MCRTQIQQQFVSGWKPVDGNKLRQEWIDLDKPFNVSKDNLKRKRLPTSLGDNSQAKLRKRNVERCKIEEINDESCKFVQTMDQDKNNDTVMQPSKKNIIDEIELPLFEKPVSDVKKDVTKKYQYWVNYPKCIINNVYRVVQSDSIHTLF